MRKLAKKTNLTNLRKLVKTFRKNNVLKLKIRKKNMTETNGLSFVIRIIDKDFTVLPVGEFIKMQINKLRRNDLFEGFNLIDLKKKEKYVYFKMDKV